MRTLLVVTVIFLPLMFITQYFGTLKVRFHSLRFANAISRHEL